MQQIPLQAVPNQQLQVLLNGQSTTLAVYQTNYALFVDVYLNGALVKGGVVGRNLTRIIRELWYGFSGDLIFTDTQGTTDPVYTGLASRYALLYVTPADLASFGLTG